MELPGQLAAEICRLFLLRGLDDRLRDWGFGRLAGVDEAGRGCLAGPVVAAAVVVDAARPVPGVDDSKSLDADQRRRLAGSIRDTAVAWSVAAVSPADIDRINILEATRIAMIRALEGLGEAPDCAVIDAVRLPPRPYPCLGVVRGDVVSYSVACASILAKVERDRMMVEIDARYPHYGFARHKGYGVAEHYRALSRFGPSPEHRLTFRSVLPHSCESKH